MVDVKVELGLRGQRAKEARERVARYAPPMVKVEPRDANVRAFIKHLPSGRGFRETGPALWPYDQFTKRRLKEGAVTLAKEEHKEDHKENHSAHHRPSHQAQPS